MKTMLLYIKQEVLFLFFKEEILRWFANKIYDYENIVQLSKLHLIHGDFILVATHK